MDGSSRPRRRLGACLLAAVLIVGACAGPTGLPVASDVPSASPGPTSTGPPPGASGPAVVLPGDATTAGAAQAELDLRHQMWRELRVLESIGADGPALLAAVDGHQTLFGEATMVALAREMQLDLASLPAHVAAIGDGPGSKPTFGAWSGGTLGQVTFTATMMLGLVALLVDVADRPYSGGLPSKTETYTSRSGGTSETTRITSSMQVRTGQGAVSADVDISSSSTITDAAGNQIGRLDGSARGHLDVNACPDPTGRATGRFELTIGEAYAQRGATASTARVIKTPITINADDDAHLTGTDLSITASGQGIDGATAPWGVDATVPVSIGDPGSPGVTRSTTSGSATAANVSDVTGRATTLAIMAIGPVAEAAEDFWRSGKCFDVETNIESRKVKPGEHVDLEVSSIRQKFDGGEIRKPVIPDFSGKESLDPAAGTPLDMPANATFNAGREPGDKGTVTFKQTSNRGIASKTLDFEVESAGVWVSIGAVRDLPAAKLTLSVPPAKLDRTDRGYELSVLAQITGTVDMQTCKVNVDADMEIVFLAVPDEADQNLFRLHVLPTGSGGVDTVDMACNGTPIQVPLPVSDFLLPFKGTSGYVELSVGETKTVRSAYVSGTATITRQAP